MLAPQAAHGGMAIQRARASLRWYWHRALLQLSEGAWFCGGMGADTHLHGCRDAPSGTLQVKQ